jgi:RNA polymerase sigma factor (sigma-70 family)
MTPAVFKNRYMKNRGYFKKYKKEPFESFETLEETYEIEDDITPNIKNTISKVLSTLTPKEEVILRWRFGIEMDRPYTLSEIGARYSVGSERIRQIEAKAIRKLKHPARSKILKEVM